MLRGVEGSTQFINRASLPATAKEFNKQLGAGLAAPGPYLIEAVL